MKSVADTRVGAEQPKSLNFNVSSSEKFQALSGDHEEEQKDEVAEKSHPRTTTGQGLSKNMFD